MHREFRLHDEVRICQLEFMNQLTGRRLVAAVAAMQRETRKR